MPTDLVARITASLAAEQHERTGGGSVLRLDSRRSRWRRAALIAAAAAVVAVALPAVLTGHGPGNIAALFTSQANEASSAKRASTDAAGGSALSQASPPAPGPQASDHAAAAMATTIYATGTAYTSAALSTQLHALVTRKGGALRPMASQSPSLGAAATPVGLQRCLAAVHVAPGEPVTADIATYNDTPAVVLVVGTAPGQRGFVLRRDCATRAGTPLAGPLTVR